LTINMKNSKSIRNAKAHEASILSRLICQAYREVAARFNRTPAACPNHASNCRSQWVENDLHGGVLYCFPIYPLSLPS